MKDAGRRDCGKFIALTVILPHLTAAAFNKFWIPTVKFLFISFHYDEDLSRVSRGKKTHEKHVSLVLFVALTC